MNWEDAQVEVVNDEPKVFTTEGRGRFIVNECTLVRQNEWFVVTMQGFTFVIKRLTEGWKAKFVDAPGF